VKIIVFGPNGMIGSRIVTELEQRGHDVTGASRASGIDATDPAGVAESVAGADAVVSAVSRRDGGATLVDVANGLTEGLRRAGVRRLVVVGGASSLEVAPGVRLFDTPEFLDEWRPEAQQGIDALVFYRTVDDLDWTFVSPAALIQPGERKASYRLGGEELLVDGNGQSAISAEDYAVAIADLVEQNTHARERVGVAW
jgi:putative NADH-flavin reductase